jgi:hypothetical protein
MHEFPNTTAPGGVRWSAHGDTKSALVRGGGEKAFAKLVDIFLDEQRPWYHGAKARLDILDSLFRIFGRSTNFKIGRCDLTLG